LHFFKCDFLWKTGIPARISAPGVFFISHAFVNSFEAGFIIHPDD